MTNDQNIPLYEVVKRKIVENITKKIWQSGMKLPSESELCDMFKVSRITVRQALMELQNEGIVAKRHGKGTFVESSKMTLGLLNLMGYTQQLRLKGVEVSQKIIKTKLLPADRDLAEKLKINLNDPIIMVHRLRYANGDPFMLSKTWIPWKMAPHLLDEFNEGNITSLFEYLTTHCKIQLLRAYDTLEPITLEKAESSWLETKEKSPALRIESITMTFQDTPVELTQSIIRGDRCKYLIEYVR